MPRPDVRQRGWSSVFGGKPKCRIGCPYANLGSIQPTRGVDSLRYV